MLDLNLHKQFMIYNSGKLQKQRQSNFAWRKVDILPSMEGGIQTKLYDAIFRNFAGQSTRVRLLKPYLQYSQRNVKKFRTQQILSLDLKRCPIGKLNDLRQYCPAQLRILHRRIAKGFVAEVKFVAGCTASSTSLLTSFKCDKGTKPRRLLLIPPFPNRFLSPSLDTTIRKA